MLQMQNVQYIAILLFSLASAVCRAQQVTLQVYNNAALAGPPIREILLTPNHTTVHVPGMVSARLMGSINVSTLVHDAIMVECSSPNTSTSTSTNTTLGSKKRKMPFMLWLDDHLVCQSGFYNDTPPHGYQMDGSSKTPIFVSPRRTDWTFYGEFWPLEETFSLANDVLNIMVTTTKHKTQVLSLLRPAISPVELQRLELVRNLQTGWGLYNHHSLQEAILLPDGIRLVWMLCKDENIQNCQKEPSIPATVLPRHPATRDFMTFDMTFMELVTIRVTYHFEGEDMRVVFQTLVSDRTTTTTNNCSLCNIRIWADIAYAPARSGTVVQPSTNSLTVHATGLRSVTFSALADPSLRIPPKNSHGQKMIHLRLPRPGSTVAITTGNTTTAIMDEKEFQLTKGQSNLPSEIIQQYYKTFSNSTRLAEVAMGIDAAIYYNLIYTPVERSLIAPVSRGWGKALCMPALSPEMEYVLFDWDNVLVAYMMAMTGKKELAYSSLIQVVRSRTAKGFVPNFSAGGAKSQDRSEPPLGAKVLREIYETYNEAWLVELLWDDLAVQIDWFWWNRRLDGFIALGSDPVAYPNAHSTNTMQGARFESGLDNSPMYDGKFFKDGLMQLYDVGMTSLVLQECESLVNLASIIGRDASQLEYRSQVLRQSLMTLWDADDGIFSNQFPNGTYSKRRSPTSFYPLLSHVATDAQAESMVEHWLMNSTRFCIGQRSSECWWGLPSISADDPAFPKLGYWRGYVWGPMSLLTYWALENYQHLPRIALAKQQLVSQMTDMFLNLWRQKGRVCENYSPNRDAKDCTGDKFYHWGALAGLLSLLEQQHEEELAVLVA